MKERNFVGHEPCPKCGSRNNLARYNDGYAKCFSVDCGYWEKGDGTTFEDRDVANPQRSGNGASISSSSSEEGGEQEAILPYEGEAKAIDPRKLSEETCVFWQYRYGSVSKKPAHLAYYLNDKRQPVACKVRWADKTFKWLGESKNVGLYGQWLWPSGGKKVVVTEGEIDCLTVSQLQGNRWPVVSVPNGAQGAARSVKKSLDWLSSFEEVIFMFDMDEPGQKAAHECAELLEPGKAKIASLPLKDPNECLLKGKGEDVIRAIWNAKVYRPDGIIDGGDLWDEIINAPEVTSIPYPWSSLNEKTHGIRQSELVTFTAGSGIGKSAVVREIAYHLITQGHTVGMIMLEESVKMTALSLMGLHLNKRLNLSRGGVAEDDLRAAFLNTIGSGRCFLYDHFGSTAVDRLLSRVRSLARMLDCKYIILDHLSIVVSAMQEDGDERKLIDKTMTLLRTLVQETGIGLIIVSHLKRPEGKGHEEGAHTSLSQLRGSHAIAQLSDIVIGLERNQQGDNPNETIMRVLKNRFSGETGEAGSLFFDNETGRLTEVAPVAEGDF